MKRQGSFEGTVTVLFTDVVGSTALRSRLGDDVTQDILHSHARIVRESIDRFGGREVKAMGDGFMVAFTGCVKAVTCACDIQRRQAQHNRLHPDQALSVRIGLNSGEVIRERDDFFGTAVNAAAKIADSARGGQILISELVKGLASPATDLHFLDMGPQELAGFTEPWRLYQVVWQQEDTIAARVTRSLAHKTPFVGRKTELSEIKALAEFFGAERPRAVIVSGEPGLGKTRLATEAAAQANDRGFAVQMGHCYQAGGPPGYGPFIEALTPLVRGYSRARLEKLLRDDARWLAKLLPTVAKKIPGLTLLPSMPADQERHLLLNSVVSFVVNVARRRPLFLVLEDLHWADRATLLLFEHLVRAARDEPVLILGTYREVELDPTHPLTETLARLNQSHLCRSLQLQPLTSQEVSRMLLALGGEQPPTDLAEAIYGETEGNPFFVEEIIKFLLDEKLLFDDDGRWQTMLDPSHFDVPSGLRLIIGHRLSKLSAASRKALNTAAVIGRKFDFELLEAACGLQKEALLNAVDEVRSGHLIIEERPKNGGFRFAHELIRQALYAELSTPRRQHLHQRVVEAVEEIYATSLNERAADLAYHCVQAGTAADRGKAHKYCVLAGDQAMSSSAFEEAIGLYEQAMSLISPRGAQRGNLYFKLGQARWSAGHWDTAITSWEEALSAYEGCDDAEGAQRTCYSIAMLLGWQGKYLQALEAIQKGVVRGAESTSEARCRLLSLAGTMLSLGGRRQAAEPLLEQALTIARQREDDGLLGNVLAAKGLHQWVYAEFQESYETLILAEELLRRTSDLSSLVYCFGYILAPLGYLGLHGEMDRRLNEFEALAKRLGASAGIASHASYAAVLAMVRGELGEAERWGMICEETGRQSARLTLPIALELLGVIRFLAGHSESAEQLFEEADRLSTEIGETALSYQAWALLLYCRAFKGDHAGAQSLMGRLEELGKPVTCGRYDAMVTVAQALVMLGRKDQAAELYAPMRQMADRGCVFAAGSYPLLKRVLGMVAWANGWWEEAAAHYETALQQGSQLGADKELAETSFWYGRMLLEREGSRDRGFALLQCAIEGYGRMGMPEHLAMANSHWQEGHHRGGEITPGR